MILITSSIVSKSESNLFRYILVNDLGGLRKIRQLEKLGDGGGWVGGGESLAWWHIFVNN